MLLEHNSGPLHLFDVILSVEFSNLTDIDEDNVEQALTEVKSILPRMPLSTVTEIEHIGNARVLVIPTSTRIDVCYNIEDEKIFIRGLIIKN